MATKSPLVEEFQVTGEKLVTSIKELVHEGNIRRISVRNERGITLLEIPFVVGVAGAVLLPLWAALGALAALVARCTLVVERIGEPASGTPPVAFKKPGRAPKKGGRAT
jgi:hypothetical protein